MQCNAKSKQSGQRCKRPASPGRSVCRLHGGATPRGIASPHWKHGRYSKALPDRMVERYEESRNDPDLIILQDDMALLDARLYELLTEVDADPTTWDRVSDLIEQRRRLAESERKRIYDARAVIPIKDIANFLGRVVCIIRDNVKDPDVLAAIVRELENCMASTAPELTDDHLEAIADERHRN